MTENARKKRRARRKEKQKERKRELKLELEEKKEKKFTKCAERKSQRLQMTKHHLIPRSRGGDNSPENILLLEKGRHECFHCQWGNMTISEVIDFLLKCEARLLGHFRNMPANVLT